MHSYGEANVAVSLANYGVNQIIHFDVEKRR